MTQIIVVYWRDIPAEVSVREGHITAKRQLTERFEKAIGRAAMKARRRQSDSYLDGWRRTDPVTCGGDLETEASAAATRLEVQHDDARLSQLIANGGLA